jgi:hypothetical protein
VLSLTAFCDADLNVIRSLKDFGLTKFVGEYSLGPFEAELQGIRESIGVLAKRMQNAIDLVSLPPPDIDF